MTNSQGTPTMKISRHFRARIYFALAGMLLSGIAISLGTGAAEPAPATQSSVSDSKAEVRAFAIRSADGPKIKTLIKAIWETWPPAEGFERKVFVHGSDLILRAEPERLKEIETMLSGEGLIRPKEEADNTVREIRAFNVFERGAGHETETMTQEEKKLFFQRMAESVETFLYARRGKARAKEEAREMWLEEQRGAIIVKDEPANLEKVGKFIAEAGGGQIRKQKVIFLEKGLAEKIAPKLEETLGPATNDGASAAESKNLTIVPFPQLNALIVRYENQEDLREVEMLAKQLDVAEPRVESEVVFAHFGAVPDEIARSAFMKGSALPVSLEQLDSWKSTKLVEIVSKGPKVTNLPGIEAEFKVERRGSGESTNLLRVTILPAILPAKGETLERLGFKPLKVNMNPEKKGVAEEFDPRLLRESEPEFNPVTEALIVPLPAAEGEAKLGNCLIIYAKIMRD